MKSLSNADINTNLIISFLDLSNDIKKKLLAFNLYNNSVIKILRKYNNGSMIIARSNSRIALSPDITSNIFVKINE